MGIGQMSALAHTAEALLNYAGQVARRADYQLPDRAWHPSGLADTSDWAGMARHRTAPLGDAAARQPS
jgi:hypothetical protein